MGAGGFSLRGGVRVVPAGTLVVTADNLIAIRRHRNTGVQFEVSDRDELWLFTALRVDRLTSGLTALGWRVGPSE
ncbi:hypothetical protein O7631_24315 [Micromonospora sp. WMMD967]|uniref:hypothetical protein n=1 Tax=Micromonospora sp. WMMD967 TaxID=3016101 RepID=UPI002416BA71|nr:hypothetical protein [Micromonospora sp. WMMD967]MDG4839662.1 hypothetical protein [Micromonospora sp. WMMD967]